MKRYRLTILGRPLVVRTDKDEAYMRKIESKINKDLQDLRTKMPHADNLDLGIFYLFLLFEKIEQLQISIERMKKSSDQARQIIQNLEKEILRELTNLSSGNKL